MQKIFKVAIVGGGASGLAEAVMLGEKLGEDVIILEKLSRVGKKITVTGNGRGNFTNMTLSPNNYRSVCGNAAEFVKPALTAFDNNSLQKFLTGIGVLCCTERGRVYPASFQASSVLDLLRLKLDSIGVKTVTEFEVSDIKKDAKNGTFTLTSKAGENVLAEKVIVAAGGKCQKQFGTDGSGYFLLEKFGHSVTECTPSLVQIKTDVGEIKQLKGIRQEVDLALYDGDSFVASERGDLLFTEFGVSGNAAFQLSGYVCSLKHPLLSVGFLPDFSSEQLALALENKIKSAPYITAEELLTGFVNKQVGRVIMARAGLSLSQKPCKTHINAIVYALKNFNLRAGGTLGFNYAQVTHGGIPLNEIDNNTMRSKKADNLYITGEVMDIDGDCGGYNLQWAFSSAYIASKHILGDLL